MRYQLESVHVEGRPRELGRAYGESLRERIQSFVPHRLAATRAYLAARQYRGGHDFASAGAACLAVLKGWDPDGWAEVLGTAEGANVDAAELYAAANYSDMRDLVLLTHTGPIADAEGCTALAIPREHTASGSLIAGQTWDLHPKDIEYVVAVHRRPHNAPESWSVTTVGCPTLMGMNSEGLYAGTTNLKIHGVNEGVPYLSLLHRAIGCRGRDEAAAHVENAPRVAAHSFWFADEDGAIALECASDTHVRRDLADRSMLLTNHCMDPSHQEREAEPPSLSSLHRIRRAEALLNRAPHSPESIKAMFEDRIDDIHSINRYPEDEQIAATNACVIGVPATRELHACRGPADQGEWRTLSFHA